MREWRRGAGGGGKAKNVKSVLRKVRNEYQSYNNSPRLIWGLKGSITTKGGKKRVNPWGGGKRSLMSR